jgi:hypothetical protein
MRRELKMDRMDCFNILLMAGTSSSFGAFKAEARAGLGEHLKPLYRAKEIGHV